MLPLRARVEQGAMAMQGYSAFPNAQALLEPYHQIVLCQIHNSRWEEGSPYHLAEMQFVYSTTLVDGLLLQGILSVYSCTTDREDNISWKHAVKILHFC